MADISTTMANYPVILPFIIIILMGIAVIIGLNCIWRVEKRLKTFMILLTLGSTVILVRKVSLLLGYGQSAGWAAAVQYFDLAVSILFLGGFVEMYRIIRRLDREEK